MGNKKLIIIIECAIMIALATILSEIAVYKLPNGGSITFASMVPLILISYRHGFKWGIFSGLVYSLIQMLLDFYAPPTTTFLYFALVIALDYIVAFAILGSASLFGKPIKNKTAGIIVGTFAVTSIRFICHFLSGILIWGSYAPEDTKVWVYSLSYNASYMVPEIILTTIVSVALLKVPQIAKKKY